MSSRRGIRDLLQKPTLWLCVGFAMVGFEGFIRIFAILGPPFVIWTITHVRGSSLLGGYINAYQRYAHEVARLSGYTSQHVYWSFAFSLIYSVVLLVLLVLLMQRRSFARQAIILLNILAVAWALSVWLWNTGNAGAAVFTPQLESVLFNGLVLLIFTRPSIGKLLNRPQTNPISESCVVRA